MTDLSNHVIVPREDFYELQANAQTITTNDRIATTVQTAAFFGLVAGSVVAGTWGWAKAVDWLDEKKFQRTLRKQSRHATR